MQIDFLDSKDGSKTFSANGVFYHSSYSPQKEAQRFIEAAQFPNNPKLIFLVEPGLNYCSRILKNRFPDAKIICIRFFDFDFPDEKYWDIVLRLNDNTSISQKLINDFGEDALLCSTVLIWPVAQKLFSEQTQDFLLEYKNCLEYCKTLLVTRQFFEKKWLLNSCSFIKYAKNILPSKLTTNKPVVICASGPELKACIPAIKNFREKVFVLCLSSALSVLVKNSITPDLIVSTDGGYWAGEHLKFLKRNPGIALASPCEAFIPKKILQKNPVLALRYNDQSSFICSQILITAGIPYLDALRNPTVSGTGLFLAKSITNNNIYFCGLDLCAEQGFQHTQPNELENNSLIFDFRIKPKELRISRARYNSSSLQIYRNWFTSLEKNQVENIYRVIDNKQNESLGNIKNITSADFFEKMKCKKVVPESTTFSNSTSMKIKANEIIEYIINELKTDKWRNQIFPADYISIQNCINEEEKSLLINRLNKKVESLVQKMRKSADE